MSIDPSGFYSRLRDGTVLKLLSKFGFPCALQVKVGEVFDPVMGVVTQAATYMILPAFGLYDPASATTREGKTLVRLNMKNVYLDASLLQITPNTDDLFQDETGATQEIVKVENTNPGGLTLLWKITVKQ